MNETQKPQRLKSLDALRGFDMLWIIGGEWVIRNLAKATDLPFFNILSAQTRHVPWSGFHFYDLIMPLFLFMVGMSIPFSTDKRLSQGDSLAKIYGHAARRFVILFVFGMICQCNLLAFDIDQLFIIHDTLQSIAIGYVFSLLLYTKLSLRWQLIISAMLLAVYWAILTFVPVPGGTAGVLEPQNNISKYVEQLVFGRFDDAPAPYTWFLGSLGFIVTVMSGVFATQIIRGKIRLSFIKLADAGLRSTFSLAVVGAVLLIVALIFNQWFVVIKALWNPTFVLLSSGICFVLMAIFYYIIDVRGWQSWSFPFRVIGMNSIFVYMAVHIVNFRDISHHLLFGLEQFAGTWYPLLQSIGALAIIYIILYWMYKKGTFLRV